MKIEIELRDETYKKLEQFVIYHNVKRKIIGTDKEETVEDTIKAAIMMYINWLSLVPSPLIEANGLTIHSRIPSIFSSQGKSLKEIHKQTGIPKSTLSGLLHGSIPNLENFIRIWLSLGQPSIHDLLNVELSE